MKGHAALVHQALDDGFAGLRVCSEIAPLLGHGHIRDEWCTYELRADVLIAGLPSVVVCACDLRQADRGTAGDVAAVHARQAGDLSPTAPTRTPTCSVCAAPPGSSVASGPSAATTLSAPSTSTDGAAGHRRYRTARTAGPGRGQ